MNRRLTVNYRDRRVGTLEQDHGGTFLFSYSEAWLSAPDNFAISVALPLRAEAWEEPAHHFFANLLPEADVRRMLCDRLGISLGNDFELLAAIGGECAGALTLLAEDQPAEPDARSYRALSPSELSRLAATQVLASIDGATGLRLSLAGAQDKLPVLIEDGEFFLPIGTSPSTHILKFPNPHYRNLPANETLVMMIARELGLPVAEIRFQELRHEGMCVVTRYDRIVSADGTLHRLHQEDLCQALQVRSQQKYEKEGGPGLVRCFEKIRDVSVDPLADSEQLLRWVAFNVIAFNADAHAKNLSLLYGDEGLRLAPFYDLLCTRAYPTLAPGLAMAVGGEFDPTLIRRAHWERLAGELGLGAKFVVSTVRAMTEAFPVATTEARRQFVEHYGEKPALQLVLPKIRRQARRVATLLDE